MRRRTAARVIAGFVVSVVACLLVAQSADVPAAFGRVLAVDPLWLVPPTFVIAIQLGIRAVRWGMLLTAVGPVRLGPRQVVGPLAAGYLGNTVLPARLGEVVRIVVVSRRTGVPATATTASVVLERAVDLLALLAIATGASGVIGATDWLPFATMLALLVVLGVLLSATGWAASHIPSLLSVRVRDVLVSFVLALRQARAPVIVRAWLLSLLAWSCDATVVWLCAQALGIPIAPGVAILIASGAAVGAALPGAAGYVGTYELGALTMAAFAGVPAEEALQIALLAHAIAVLPLAVAGFVAVVAMSLVPARHSTGGPVASDLQRQIASTEAVARPGRR